MLVADPIGRVGDREFTRREVPFVPFTPYITFNKFNSPVSRLVYTIAALFIKSFSTHCSHLPSLTGPDQYDVDAEAIILEGMEK